MRVLTDTNILFSAILFPRSNPAKALVRDVTDQPILNAAIDNNIDIILTGDKDFLIMDIKRPKCMTAVEFLKEEGYL